MSVNTIYFDPEAKEFLISYGTRVVAFEREDVFDDDGQPIAFRIDTGTFFVDQGDEGVVHFVFIDADTGGIPVSPTINIDGTAYDYPPFSSVTRTLHEFPVNKKCRRIRIRLDANVLGVKVKIQGITIDTRGGSGRRYSE